MTKQRSIDQALYTGSLSRREVLGLLGVAGTAVLTGARSPRAESAAANPAESTGLLAMHHSPIGCVVTPSQTEGPYFVDERLERSDVRVDPTDGSTREGTPLRIRFAVARVDGNACTPVTGAYVDIWQCDAAGVYSDVKDFQGLFDTTGRKFLRGHQITDRKGTAEFLTVYPGWYAGRSVHIHFKVRMFEGARRAHEFTSQLYFDEAVTDVVHSSPPYNTKGRRDTLNERDGIYRRGGTGAQLMLPVTKGAGGYDGDFAVGLRMS